MKMKQLTLATLCILFGLSCSKPKEEVLENEYKRITLISTSIAPFGTDSLIIDLNSNSTIQSIMAYERSGGNFILRQTKTEFYYLPDSQQIDSTCIESQGWLGNTSSYIEKFVYENGKIVKSYRLSAGTVNVIDSVIYSYNSEGKLRDKFTYEGYIPESFTYHTNYKYNEDNLSSVSTINSQFMKVRLIRFFGTDGKKNPFNRLFKKNGYLFVLNILPSEIMLCSNNPTFLYIDELSINMSYKYNQYNDPIEVFSNWGHFNARIIYE